MAVAIGWAASVTYPPPHHTTTTTAGKVATALKLSEEDDVTIEGLKKQIERAWKMVGASHEKEVKANETIQKLKAEITTLSRLVEKGAGLIGQGNTVEELIKVRDVLQRRLDEAQRQNQDLGTQNEALLAELEHRKQKNRAKKAEVRAGARGRGRGRGRGWL